MNKNVRKSLKDLINEYQDNDVISSIEQDYKAQRRETIPVDKIRFNPFSSHQFFSDKRLKDLTDSIKNNGVVNPILVREGKNGYYEVISGYKRFYVAKKLHLATIPVVIADISDNLAIFMVLSRGHKKLHDNILNKTYTYLTLTKDYHVKRSDIALISKQSISQVNNILRLATLDEEVKLALKKEKISYGQARVLVGLDEPTQKELLNKMINGGVSVREIERIVKKLKKPDKYQDIVAELASSHNCQINITEKNITIKFHSRKELEAFIDILKNKGE